MSQPLLTLVIAYYNEQEFIGDTIRSVLAQEDRRFGLILVDNMSTDASTERAREVLADANDLEVQFVTEEKRGQVFALMRGISASSTPYVATLDADTWYPPQFVGRAISMLEEHPRASVSLALNVGENRSRKTGGAKWLWARIWPRKCQGGGAGHCYRREMFKRAGGLDVRIWPYILFDHEIAHRMRKLGPFVYRRDHVIHASERPDGSTSRSWNPLERAMYKFIPSLAMDWFFYRFLGPRLRKRGLFSVPLRDGELEGGDV